MKIKLTNCDEFAQVSKQDYPEMSKYKWYKHVTGYAICTERQALKMHHAVLGKPPEGKEVDHINRNRLDNRRGNLKFCTRAENMQNKSQYKNNKSGYLGVCLHASGRWMAQATVQGVRHYIGLFKDPALAHEAYINFKNEVKEGV